MRSCVTTSQSLTAISRPTCDRSDATSLISTISTPSGLHALRRVAVEAASLCNQTLEQRRRIPVVAESSAVLLDAREHRRQPDRVGVEHRSAALPWEAEAVDVDDIDVAGARGVAFLQHPRAFVRERRGDAR